MSNEHRNVPGHMASFPPCKTNHTHPHIRAFSKQLFHKYKNFKSNLQRTKGIILECDYCDNFFKAKEDRSQLFLELFNLQGKKKSKLRKLMASERASQNTVNMYYQQSNFITIDVNSHQQRNETTHFGTVNNQQSSDKMDSNTLSSFHVESSHQTGSHQPVAHQMGSHQPVSHQMGSHQPGYYQQRMHQPGSYQPNTRVNVPNSTRNGQTVITLSKKARRKINKMKQLERNKMVWIKGLSTTQKEASHVNKNIKSDSMMRTVHYTEPGQSKPEETLCIEELTEDTGLTDIKSQKPQQTLPEIKINIVNKPSSSKSRTVNIEGKDATKTAVPKQDHAQELNTTEPHNNQSSANPANEKHISTYKAPFHTGPSSKSIPRLIGRVSDKPPSAADEAATTGAEIFVITPTSKHNVVVSQRSDPFQSITFCPIHQISNCSCRNAPELPKSEQLKVVLPNNATMRTVYVSQEAEASVDGEPGRRVCRRKRKGIPRDLALSTASTYQAEAISENDSELECKLVNEGTPDASDLPDLLMSVYQTDMQTDRVSNTNEHKLHEKTEDKQGPSKKRRTDSRPTRQTDEYVSIFKRQEIICSIDKTVKSLVKSWPWEKKLKELITVTHDGGPKQQKAFKNILEEADLEYPSWIKIKVTGYPRHWDRQKLLDTLINWQDVSRLPLTPCFIEYRPRECMFLVYNCAKTLEFLYSRGLVVHGDDYRMNLSITQLAINQLQLRFRLPKFLEYRLNTYYDKEAKAVNLSEFLREADISMMCHFPLNKIYNQKKLMELKIDWKHVTKLNISNNQLTTLEGFNLPKHLPELADLDIGDNWFESTSQLWHCRGAMSVRSVRLEGNPICLNFIQRDEYTDVAKFLFPNIDYLDGVKISGLLDLKRNYCPYPEAEPLVERFLELYFNLLESKYREELCSMYSVGSMLTLSCQSRLKKLPEYENLEMVRACRDVRLLNEVMDECFVGNEEISSRLAAWAPVAHDPHSFTVDVIQKTETSIVLTVTGTLRVLCQPAQEDCPLLDFTRTFVLSTRDGTEYVINNDLWYVAMPTSERSAAAFVIEKPKLALSLQLETAPDEDLKAELIEIFMKLTSLKRSESLRCLELRNWNIRCALQYFIQLLEVNEVSTLSEVR